MRDGNAGQPSQTDMPAQRLNEGWPECGMETAPMGLV